MDLRNGLVAIFVFLVVLVVNGDQEDNSNVVFQVKHKFRGRGYGRGDSILTAFKAHDDRRHGRMLAAVDLPLGGNGSPTDTALVISSISTINFICIPLNKILCLTCSFLCFVEFFMPEVIC